MPTRQAGKQRRRARGWGVAHPAWYIPRGNPRADVKLTREERQNVAKRIVGKPFVLMHDNEHERNKLGTVTAAFVDVDGTLHTQFEFDGEGYHSTLVKQKALRKQCHGLSLAVLASHRDGVLHRADVPVELTACPLNVARKGDACEMYWVDGNWLCDDSKRDGYKRSLSKAGYALEEEEEEEADDSAEETTSESLNTSTTTTTTTMGKDDMDRDDQPQRQKKKQRMQEDDLMDEDPAPKSGSRPKSRSDGQGNLEDKVDRLLKELDKERSVREELEKRDKAREDAETEKKLKELEGSFQSMLESVEMHLKMLVQEGFPTERAEGLLKLIEEASKEQDPEARAKRMEELQQVMELVNYSHAAVEKQSKKREAAEQSYKMLATELRSTKQDKKRAEDRLEKHETERENRKQKYKTGGIESRVETGDKSRSAAAAGTSRSSSSSSSSNSSSGGSAGKKRMTSKRRESAVSQDRDDDDGEEEAAGNPGRPSGRKKGKNRATMIHKRVATDEDIPAHAADTLLAPKPLISSSFMEYAPRKPGATFGIPAITGGLKKTNPTLWNSMLTQWRATAPTGPPQHELTQFAGRFYSGVDTIAEGDFRAKSSNPPRLPAPGELLGH